MVKRKEVSTPKRLGRVEKHTALLSEIERRKILTLKELENFCKEKEITKEMLMAILKLEIMKKTIRWKDRKIYFNQQGVK